MLRFSVLLALVVARPDNGRAQETPTATDSLRSYDLAEIVVREASTPAQASTVHQVTLAEIVRQDAASVADVGRLVPAAHVQTNSRGETLLYLRAAGERQVAFFFDGALLNVPWDNRVDLSLVPASVLGGITVAKGVPSILYGTNVLGGAVNMVSRDLEHPGTFTEGRLQRTHPHGGLVQGGHLGHRERMHYAVAAGWQGRRGRALPSGADLPFSQPGETVRTNTDSRLVHAFGRVAYAFSEVARLGASVLHIDGEKGVAPEGHLDPAVSRVRFWRYPTWQNTLLIINGAATLPANAALRGAAWVGRFAQTIDQFGTARYDVPEARQEDEDLTLGVRVTVDQPAGPGVLRVAVNALTSEHEQRDLSLDAVGNPVPPAEAPFRTYAQHVFSAGGEYEANLSDRVRLAAGGSLDGVVMPKTGDKPPREAMVDYGLLAGLSYALPQGARVRVAAGRKVRFPTMRELFGEALNRFVLNDDLRPETALLAELGVAVEGARLSGEAVAFLNRTYDTIDQQTVAVDGVSKRQRINLEGSRILGLELAGAWRLWRYWTVGGHATWMYARALEGAATRPLTEKPAWLGTANVAYTGRQGVSVLFQMVGTGKAYGMGEDGQREPLPASLAYNVRLGYRFTVGSTGLSTELYVHTDNVTDVVTLPQLGLPAPGREVSAGLDLTF